MSELEEGKKIMKFREETWMKLVKHKGYIQRLGKIIDRKTEEYNEDNFISKDHTIELYVFMTMFKELNLRAAKYIRQDISQNEDAIWMKDALPKAWETLDGKLEELERIIEDKNKEQKRGGFVSKDWDMELTLLCLACGELNLREAERQNEPGIKL